MIVDDYSAIRARRLEERRDQAEPDAETFAVNNRMSPCERVTIFASPEQIKRAALQSIYD